MDKNLIQIQALNQLFSAAEKKWVDEIDVLKLDGQKAKSELDAHRAERDTLLLASERLKSDYASQVAALVSQHAEMEKNLLEQMGDVKLSLQDVTSRLDAQLVERDRLLIAQKRLEEEHISRVAAFMAEQHSHDQVADGLRRALAKHELQSAEQSRRLGEQDIQIAAQMTLLATNQVTISSLEHAISDLTDRNARLLADWDTKMTALGDVRRDRDEKLAKLEQALRDSDEEIGEANRLLLRRADEMAAVQVDLATLRKAHSVASLASQEHEASGQRLTENLARMSLDLERLRANLASQKQEIARLHQVLFASDEEIGRANKAILELTHKGDLLSRTVLEKDSVLTSLNESILADRQKHTASLANMRQLESENTRLENALSALESTLLARNNELSARDAELSARNVELSELARVLDLRVLELGTSSVELGQARQELVKLKKTARQREISLSAAHSRIERLEALVAERNKPQDGRSGSLADLLLSHDEEFIQRTYRMVLGRDADPQGLNHYLAQMRRGVGKLQVIAQIAHSKEALGASSKLGGSLNQLNQYLRARVPVVSPLFDILFKARLGGQLDVVSHLMSLDDDRQFIERTYVTLLRRKPDPEGMAYYATRLRSGFPRIQVLNQIRVSTEGRKIGAEVPGLDAALVRYRLSLLPLLGGVFGSLLGQEGDSISDRRIRAIERQSTVSAKAVMERFNKLEDTVYWVADHAPALANAGLARRPSATQQGVVVSREMSEQPIFFTICSKNFTAYAKTLFESVRTFHPSAETFLFLCDEVGNDYQVDQLPFNVVSLEALDIPDVQGMSKRYNITEFNTAIKPFAFAYLFKRLAKNNVIYVDPDILLTSPLQEVMDEFAGGADCILTPHVLQPAENVEVSDVKMLIYGIYNLGFIALRNTPDVVNIVEWWSRRLERDCVIDLQNGLFVDQKWADLLPAYIVKTSILHHAGYNVAYWNLSQRVIRWTDGAWISNDVPLRFVHFSGNKLEDPQVFSRHSWSITRATIGEMATLLDHYRDAVYRHGHAEYSKLPYSFSWNGAGGVNLHTPKPEHQPDAKAAPSKIVDSPVVISDGQATSGGQVQGSWMPTLLFIDWSTPRPDKDAGSITAFYLLKLLVDLGYKVTFVPSDLQPLGHYTQAVQNLGVRCLHQEDISSVRLHLEAGIEKYDFVFICRAPIASLYVEDIRAYSPDSRIILNTSDLHYLRDMREAEIAGDPEMIKAAQAAKAWELDILRRCDVTIVMSAVEADILQQELPGADVRLIPLMYVEAALECPSYESRRDILFIGGFPHKPNVDAVIYFCNEIFPTVRKGLPGVKFHIVGNAPPAEVVALGKLPGVVVHGYVEDIGPLFQKCRLSVAPLRYGAGIKGKIGTSLAYGVPVVASSIAVEGMYVEPNMHVLVADRPAQFAAKVVKAYKSKTLWEGLSRNGREQMIREYSPAAGHRRLSQLMRDIDPRFQKMDVHALKSAGEYHLLKAAIDQDLAARGKLEQSLIDHDRPNFHLHGFCAVCGSESSFDTSFMYAYEVAEDGRPIPNWREHLDCVKCGFANRIRAALHLFYSRCEVLPSDRIYVTEQNTALFRWLRTRQANVTGSEHLGASVPLGAVHNGLRNEDLTRLTFDDNTFKYVLSFDVMEHVSDDMAAFKEVYRCLQPGGVFIFAAPFSKERSHKVVRARLSANGEIEHLLDPEYHGNPVDAVGGALCFRYFAWDVLDDLKSAGFKNPQALHYWSPDFMYFGVEQFLFVASK